MKNTINLTKIYFKESLSNSFNSTNKRSIVKNVLYFIFLFIFIALCLGYSLYNMAIAQMQLYGSASSIILIGLLMSTIMVIMMTAFDTQGYFYKSKDYEILQSLPIKTTSVVTAKYLSSYMMSFIYNAMIGIPTFVVYFYFEQISALAIVIAVFGLLLLPAFTQLIGSLLAWVINIISSKMKNKNIMRSILTILFLILLYVFIFSADTTSFTDAFVGDIPLAIKIILPQIYFLYNSVINVSLLWFLAFVGISLLFAIISILVVSISYKKINSALNISIKSKRKGKIYYKKTTIFSTLLKKEAKTFVSSPVYLMNGIIGPILLIVVAIVIGSGMKGVSGLSLNIYAVITMSLLTLSIGMVPTTAVSISMEGSKLFNLKSLPIKYSTIILSKISFNLLLVFPFLLIAQIILWIINPFEIGVCVLLFFYYIISLILYVSFGMLMNLKMPRLKWSSETQAVKQGGSMLITMIVNLVLSFLPMIIYFLFSTQILSMGIVLYMGLMFMLNVVLAIIVISLLFTIGKKLFNKIQ